MITSLHTKIGRGWVTRRFDDLLARSRILAYAILLGGVSSAILLEHEVEEVHLLEDVVDGHAVKHLTIRHGCCLSLLSGTHVKIEVTVVGMDL